MRRRIIKIDEAKCNGCGLCTVACHEGAIGMVEGKAKLLRDDYCDGLGDCLPVCPTGAITFEERDAAAYDDAAVKERIGKMKKRTEKKAEAETLPCGCPGTRSKTLRREPGKEGKEEKEAGLGADMYCGAAVSRLNQWPCQIKLVPANAPYLDGANLLIAADCTAYAYAEFHERFMKGRITLIGCPKLDEGDYAEKLAAIFMESDPKSVTVVRMEVPCCAGIVNAVKTALRKSGKMIPWRVVTIAIGGEIIEDC